VVTLSFSAKESRNTTCNSIEVIFRENDQIRIEREEIIRLVKSADTKLTGKQLRKINAYHIEKEIEKHQAVYKAEVYKITARDTTSYSGILGVKIRHRDPAVRIMSSSGSYYLDRFGEKIPLSVNYAANVLVITGNFSDDYARERLLPFVLFIESDSFWKAQIQQIHVKNQEELILTPLVGDHLIELGSIDDYENKLSNIKAFYKQVLARNNWNKYARISVKYRNQVIAKRR
jgi:cell division protein FtsQ